MELRVLKYFLMVAREGSITAAANALHITQPTLSRQIRELEEEVGSPLFVRGSHSISLTEEGVLLRKRASEILELVEKTQREMARTEQTLSGDVFLGAGETVGVHYLTQTARELQRQHPDVHVHISSGDGSDVLERLDKGLVDFALVFGSVDLAKYHAIALPYKDFWGVLMRKDSMLAQKQEIRPEDLADQPLILSRQAFRNELLSGWFGKLADRMQVVGTYNLVFNGSLMVEDGIGYALCLDKIIRTSEDSPLCFRPLSPKWEAGMYVLWKKYPIFAPAAERYLELLLKLGTPM